MRYKTYIDIGSGYEEFTAANVEPFKEVREKDQYFKRWQWGEVEIKNYPELYSSSPLSIYKLYDVIKEIDPTTEIKIKFETDLETIEGYFGTNDCEFKDNGYQNVLTVKPTVLDRYTNILEEWETKIDFSDIDFSDDSIDLNVKDLGVKTINDWDSINEYRVYNDLLRSYVTLTKIAPNIDINLVKSLALNPSDDLSGFFDNEAPLPALRQVPPIAELSFQDFDGFYLGDREEVLGDDYSSIDLTGDNYVWISTDEYGVADIETSLDNIVWYRPNPSAEYKAYKSIQAGNIGNQPDISPSWWEEFDRGEIFPDKGDYELSSVTIWFDGGTYGFPPKHRYYITTKFSREEFRKVDEFDESGDLIPPQGSGWHQRAVINVSGQDGHLWTRKPFNASLKDDWILQPTETNQRWWSSTDPFKWKYKRETRLSYTNSEDSIITTTAIVGRTLFDYILQNTNDAFADKNVKSTFFFNDDEEDLQVLEDRVGDKLNYVTMRENYLNNIYFILTRNLTPNIDLADASSFPDITLKDFFEDLNKLFKGTLYWFIDDDSNLRIEHIKYLDLTKSPTDLRGDELLEFTEEWKYDKSSQYNRIELRQVNASGIDFTENLILFNKIVSNKRNQDIKKEFETKILSTDIRYAIENSTDLEDGIMMIATFDEKISETETQKKVKNKFGLRSGVEESNGYLALSNIIEDFGRYEGVWTTGEVNGLDKTFETTSRTKNGVEIELRGLKNNLFYITEIGEGILDDSTVDFDNETTKLNLRYRYNSTPLGDRFALMVQKEENFDGAENILFDFANY